MSGLFDDAGNASAIGTGLLGGGLPAVVQEATVVVRAPVGTTLESIPDPHPPLGDGPLTPEEEQELAACKAGLNHLQDAFWVAGKCVETMGTGNLTRGSGYKTYEEFLWEEFEISKSQAYRLLAEWRTGEALAAMGWRPRESQVRALTDVIRDASPSTAVAVYDAVARTEGKVTADLLKKVVRQLPPLAGDAAPSYVHKVVQGALRPGKPEGSDSQVPGQRAGSADGSESTPAVQGSAVTAPQAEPTSEPEAEPSEVMSPEVVALIATLAELKDTTKRLSKAAVRRALDTAPEQAEQLIADIKTQLNRLGGIVAAKPSKTE